MTSLDNNKKPLHLSKLLTFLIGFILICTLLKGARIPNLWTYTHFLFNYEFGFMRRGLIGAAYGLFNPTAFAYSSFLYLSLGIFCLNAVLMLKLISRLTASQDHRIIAAMLIYFSSASIVYQAHSIGFAENIGLSLCLISFLIPSFKSKILFIGPAFSLLLLIHEANMILYFPTLFMSLIFTIDRQNKNQHKALAALSLYFIVLFLFITTQTLDKSTAALMQTSAQQRADLTLNPIHFELLWHSSENILPLLIKHWSNPGRLLMFLGSALLLFPLCLILLRYSLALLKHQPISIKILSVLASISPLLLHLVAWDTIRWNALVLSSCFLMLINIKLHSHNQHYPNISWQKSLILAVFLVFIQSQVPVLLFDGYQSQNLPFIHHLQYIQQLITGAEQWPPLPAH
ncbi:MAG: hypothetical protein HRU20_22380 [Pseudomonadales bacterium]|nr:hypothetical protein [Pseudomonadales bacterium]